MASIQTPYSYNACVRVLEEGADGMTSVYFWSVAPAPYVLEAVAAVLDRRVACEFPRSSGAFATQHWVHPESPTRALLVVLPLERSAAEVASQRLVLESVEECRRAFLEFQGCAAAM